MRAFARLWDEITRERYGVEDPEGAALRYGVQVNSLGLTEAQPENNVQRIVLEMLAVTLSRDARARAVQLPAWNEALGLPRPWDQQWALRMQQVLAYETDLLEYEDLFDGSPRRRGQGRRARRGRARGDRPGAGDGRGGRGRRVRLHEGPAGRVAGGAAAADRVGRGRRRRGEPVRDHRAQPAAGRRRRGDRDGRPGGRGRRRRGDPGVAGRARRRSRRGGARRAARRRQDRRQPHGGLDRLRQGGRDDGRVGGRAARGVRRVPGADGGVRPPCRTRPATRSPPCASGCGRPARSWAPAAAHARRQARARRALQRRRAGGGARPRRRVRGRLPGHPADARRRSSRPRCRRACTSSGSRCCRARTWRSSPPWSRGCARPASDDVPVVVGGIIPPEDAEALRDAGGRAPCSRRRTSGSPR